MATGTQDLALLAPRSFETLSAVNAPRDSASPWIPRGGRSLRRRRRDGLTAGIEIIAVALATTVVIFLVTRCAMMYSWGGRRAVRLLSDKDLPEQGVREVCGASFGDGQDAQGDSETPERQIGAAAPPPAEKPSGAQETTRSALRSVLKNASSGTVASGFEGQTESPQESEEVSDDHEEPSSSFPSVLKSPRVLRRAAFRSPTRHIEKRYRPPFRGRKQARQQLEFIFEHILHPSKLNEGGSGFYLKYRGVIFKIFISQTDCTGNWPTKKDAIKALLQLQDVVLAIHASVETDGLEQSSSQYFKISQDGEAEAPSVTLFAIAISGRTPGGIGEEASQEEEGAVGGTEYEDSTS